MPRPGPARSHLQWVSPNRAGRGSCSPAPWRPVIPSHPVAHPDQPGGERETGNRQMKKGQRLLRLCLAQGSDASACPGKVNHVQATFVQGPTGLRGAPFPHGQQLCLLVVQQTHSGCPISVLEELIIVGSSRVNQVAAWTDSPVRAQPRPWKEVMPGGDLGGRQEPRSQPGKDRQEE